MAVFNKYPYSNFQELNLDWILQELKDLTDQWEVFEDQFTGVTADAQTVPYGSGASVTVTGGGATPYNFDFNIPAGQDLTLTGQPQIRYNTSQDVSSIPGGTWTVNPPTSITPGYYLWTRIVITYSDNHTATYYTYARQGIDGGGAVSKVNGIGPDGSGNVTLPIPSPSNTTPLVDVTGGNEGSDPTYYARADHQHPTDPSKLDTATGNVGEKNAYIIDGLNTQTTLQITSSATADKIAAYDASAHLNTASPTASSNAVNLSYANTTYLSKTDAVTDYVQKTDIATSSSLGIVQPDNATITVDSDGILSVSSSVSFDELWTNSSPNASWSTTSINITGYDMNNYKMILMVFKIFNTTASYMTMACPFIPNLTFRMQRCDQYNQYREFSFGSDGTSITVDVAKRYTTYGSTTSDVPAVLVPYKVYGLN